MNRRIAFLAVITILLFGTPLLAAASGPFQPYWGPLLSCTGNYGGTVVDSGVAEGGVTARCTSLCDVLATFQNFVHFAYTVAIFIFAPIAAAVAGSMMLLSAGKPEMISQGKKLLTSTVIGLVLMLGAYVIVQTMIYVLDQGRQLGGGENELLQWGAITCNAPGTEGNSTSTTSATCEPSDNLGPCTTDDGQAGVFKRFSTNCDEKQCVPTGGGFGGGGATGDW